MGLTISRKKKKGRGDDCELIREKVRTGIGFKMSVRSAESEPMIKAMMRNETAIPGASPTLYTNELLLNAINDYEEEQSLALCNQYIQRGGKIKHIRDFDNKSVLHYAVEKKYVNVAALFLEHDVDPMITDNKDATALDLALKKGLDDMAALLVRKTSRDRIQELADERFHDILNVKFEKTLLAVLDSFMECDDDGCHSIYIDPLERKDPNVTSKCLCTNHRNSETAFQVIARKERKSIICHPVMRVLIDTKWRQWVKCRFLCYFANYLFSLVCLTYSVVSVSTADDAMEYKDEFQISRGVFEIISVVYALLTLITEFRQLYQHKIQYLKQSSNYVEVISSALIIVTLALRLVHSNVQWYVLAAAYILWILRVFKYTCVFSGVGTYVEALRHILLYDFIEFAAVFLVILLGFSGTFILVARGEGQPVDGATEFGSIWMAAYLGFRTMIEAQSVAEYTGDESKYMPITTFVMIVFIFVTVLVMLNILIAKLSNTYHNIQVDSVKGLLVHRAAIIARAEKNDFSSKIPFRWFPCNNRQLLAQDPEEKLYNVDLTLLEPKLDISADIKLETVVDESYQKQVDNNLQIQTIKNRLVAYMTDMNKRIDDVEAITKRGEKYLISIQEDVKKLVKRKGSKVDIEYTPQTSIKEN